MRKKLQIRYFELSATTSPSPEIAYRGDHRPFQAKKRIPHETNAGCCSAHATEPWGGATRAISLRKREGEASKRLQPAWIHNLSNCPFRVTARPLYAAPRQRGSNCTTLGPRRFYQGMGRPLQAATRGVTTSRSYIVFTGTFYNRIISSTCNLRTVVSTYVPLEVQYVRYSLQL